MGHPEETAVSRLYRTYLLYTSRATRSTSALGSSMNAFTVSDQVLLSGCTVREPAPETREGLETGSEALVRHCCRERVPQRLCHAGEDIPGVDQ